MLNECILETLILSDSNFISARNKEAWIFEGQVNFKKKEIGERHVPIRIFLFLGAKPSVLLPKSSQGASLAAFLASIQRILLPYETA